MTEKEMMQRNVEEFSRLQGYMLLAEKDSETYRAESKIYRVKNYIDVLWYRSYRT